MTSTAIHSTTTTSPAVSPAPGRGVLLALASTGAILLVLGASLGPTMMFDSRPYSELAGTTQHLAHYATWTIVLVALSQLLPRLAGMHAGTGRRVSTAAASVAGAGVALDACARFSLAFVNPFLADHEPRLLDTPPDAVLLVPTIGAGVVAMIGIVWLGISGWRARVFPRPAVVLLVVGAVAIPAIGPLSNVLIGAALLWIGSAALRRD